MRMNLSPNSCPEHLEKLKEKLVLHRSEYYHKREDDPSCAERSKDHD